MSTTKFEVEKFTGRNDFGLWRLKMKAILMQQGLWDVLKGSSDDKGEAELDEKEKAKAQDMQYKAYSTLILNLTDRVLREVAKEDTAAAVWAKLEGLYMTKSLANRLHLKQKLLTFKIADGKDVLEQLEEFGKCLDDLENIDEEIRDEDKALMLLNSLPSSYEHFKDAMLLGRESKISYEEVYSALKLKEVQKTNSKPVDVSAESLNIKATKGKKGFKKKFPGPKQAQGQKGGQEVEKETRSCHYCKKPGHLKRNCYSWKKKQAEEENAKPTTDCVEELDVAHALNIVQGQEAGPWIMDSGCSFHMCPIKDWFSEFTDYTGSVLLGNNQICSIKGIGSIKFKMHDGSTKTLTKVRYIPEIKRNLVSLGVLESKGYVFVSAQGKMRVMKGSGYGGRKKEEFVLSCG